MLMLLPFQVTMVPNVLTLRQMGLLNTVWAVILPMCFAPFYIFLLRQFMVGLPKELLEAAEMDGAGTIPLLYPHRAAGVPPDHRRGGGAVASRIAGIWWNSP